MTRDEALSAARALLDNIEAERNRLADELNGGSVFLGDVVSGGAAQSYRQLIEQLERFVVDVFNRVEARALAEPEPLGARTAARLLDSTRRILGAAATATPEADAANNAKRAVDNAMQELLALLQGLMRTLTFVAGAVILTQLLGLFRRR